MAHTLLPTTTAQVSGHKFLQRRVEHGLVMGDIRMLHDPLAKRQRAFIFGTVAVVLLALGSGLLAWLRPEPHPGDAAIVRTGHGQVLVRVDDRLHPVANIASARLIAGEATDPQALGDEALHAAPRGVPLGIAGAPESLATGGATGWHAWSPSHSILTALDPGPALPRRGARSSRRPCARTATRPGSHRLGQRPGRLAAAGSQRSCSRRDGPEAALGVTAHGRTQVDMDNDEDKRWWDLDAKTPRWPAPPGFVEAFEEQPGNALAERLGSSASPRFLEPPSAASTSSPPAWLCADASGGAGVRMPHLDTVALPTPRGNDVGGHRHGAALATRFGGLDDAVGVDTGGGFAVVSASGYLQAVPDAAALDVLGAGGARPAPWPIVALLPKGPGLGADAAAKPLVE